MAGEAWSGRSRVVALVAALCALLPASARAQAGSSAANLPDPVPPRISTLSLSFGAGPMEFRGRKVALGAGAVQVGLARHLAVEFEVGRWVEADAPGLQSDGQGVFEINRRAVTLAGGNLLFRAGSGRISGFAGGGLGVHVIQQQFAGPVDPFSGVPLLQEVVSDNDSTALGVTAVGGFDVAVTPRVHGVAAIRAQLRPEANIGFSAGVRLVLRTRPGGAAPGPVSPTPTALARAEGKTVRVIHLDGRRQSGRLIALDASDVVIARDGTAVRIPLADVRLVERPAHWARNLALAGAGFFGVTAIVDCAYAGCGSEGLSFLAVYAAVSTGAGLGIGAMINAATAGGRVVYRGR
jgi:hypothetical protein